MGAHNGPCRWEKVGEDFRCLDCGRIYDPDDRQPVARRTDPSTSWEAADSVNKVNAKRLRQIIVEMLHQIGPMTDEEIWAALGRNNLQRFTSLSGARTRRAELVDQRRVRHSNRYKLGRTNRKMVIWEAV